MLLKLYINPEFISLLLLLLLLSRFSRVRPCATPQTAAHQAPLSLGFSRQEYWNGVPFPSPIHAYMLSRFSRAQLCLTPWAAAHQAPLSTGFSRQEYWSGLPFPSPSFTDSNSQNSSPFGAPALLLDTKHHARPFPSAPSFNPCHRPLRSEEEGQRGSPFRMEKLRLSSGFFHRPKRAKGKAISKYLGISL